MMEYGIKRTSVPVMLFAEISINKLKTTLVTGDTGLESLITEAAINRPGLALSGFFQHFAFRRIQIIGLAEHSYLSSLSKKEREKRLIAFFEKKIPCVVITRNKKVFPEIIVLAEKYGVSVLRTKMITKHFINAATIIMENLMAPKVKVQGTMVEIMGIGVLIKGKAGIGKSETALALVNRGHALISDDITSLRLDSSGALIASPVNVTRYHMDIRGLGIIHVPSLFGVASVREEKRLDLVATLLRMEEVQRKESYFDDNLYKLFSVRIPSVEIPVASGRDLTNLLETVALDQKLRRLGHDAAKEFDENLMTLMSKGMNGSE